MQGERIGTIEKVFRSLANRRRLAIVRLLSKHEELPVAEVAKRIKLSFTSTSKHLVLLHKADILDRRQEKLVVFYRLADTMSDMVQNVLPFISNSRE